MNGKDKVALAMVITLAVAVIFIGIGGLVAATHGTGISTDVTIMLTAILSGMTSAVAGFLTGRAVQPPAVTFTAPEPPAAPPAPDAAPLPFIPDPAEETPSPSEDLYVEPTEYASEGEILGGDHV